MQLADSTRPGSVTSFEFPNSGATEPRLVISREVKTTPHLESLGILGVLAVNSIELSAHGRSENNRLFNPHLVHIADPLRDLRRSLGIGMRVHINDRVSRLRNLRYRNFVDGLRTVILEQYLLGGFPAWLAFLLGAVPTGLLLRSMLWTVAEGSWGSSSGHQSTYARRFQECSS